MATAHEQPARTRPSAEEEFETSRSAEYRMTIEELADKAQQLEDDMRASGYERVPDDKEVDRLLFKLTKADSLLPSEHELRKQLQVQEQLVLSAVENIKKTKKYLRALENAEKAANEFRVTIEDRESMKDMSQPDGDQSDADRELRRQMEAARQQDIERQFREFYNPIFRDLPENHPVRQKHADEEEKLKDIMFKGVKEREEKKRMIQEQAQTRQDMSVPERPPFGNPPPEKIHMSDLMPDEAKTNPDITAEQEASRTAPHEADGQDPEDEKKYIERLELLLKHTADLEVDIDKAKEKYDTELLNETLSRLFEDTTQYAELRTQLKKPAEGTPAWQLSNRYDELVKRLHQKGSSWSASPEQGHVSARPAMMPRIPAPPYRMRYTNAGRRRATLAVAPATSVPAAPMSEEKVQARAIPPLPDDIAGAGDDEKLAYLETLIASFQTEHARLINEHNALVNKLTEQVKERKLQALRDSLK